ncbi:hypothetical protein [Comamonas sp. MYb396]|uniref:hypothetical protein n=1 Tax=Comamonas sp. MYb396 TaxID=2745302 RepID=UPI0030B25958
MKKLTIPQARLELDALINQQLTGQANHFLRERLAQYMNAVEAAINDLQQQVDQIRQTKN